MSSPAIPPMTMWVWPSGMYPRRVAYYLKAKHLPSSVLSNLNIIPVHIDMAAGTLTSVNGLEERPTGASLPVLRIGTAPSPTIIYQSSAILEYFEDIYPSTPESKLACLTGGADPVRRAHVRQIVQHINESLVWTNVYLRHGSPLSLVWTGMSAADQSPSVAAGALARWKECMVKLEGWVREDVVGKKAKGIAGGDEPTLADFTVISASDYLFEMYKWDIFEGCEVIKEWVDKAKRCDWYMSKDEVDRLETDGFSSLFSG